MTSAANPQPFQDTWNQNRWGQNPASGQSAWGQNGPNQRHNDGWSMPPFWHPYGMSRPFGIAMMVLGFIFWWPVGLALLFYMVFSGRIGCGGRRWARNDHGGNGWQSSPPWSGWAPWSNWCGGGGNGGNQQTPRSSGNHAFDEYRAETLRRLEEEQNEFSSFLERLRFAKDKAEFDQFMAERRQAPRPPAAPEEPLQG